MLDLSFWLLVAGLGGSRLLFVLLNAGDFARLCTRQRRGRDRRWRCCATAPPRCGCGTAAWCSTAGRWRPRPVAWRFGRRRGWRFAVLGDVFAPGAGAGPRHRAAGLLRRRLLLRQGRRRGAWAAAFPAGQRGPRSPGVAGGDRATTAPLTPPLHPTQLYESAALLALFFVLLAIGPGKRFHGQVLLTYVLGYAGLRFVLELFRGDVSRRFLFQLRAPALAQALGLPAGDPLLLSTAQVVSLVLLASGAGGVAPPAS